MQNKGFIDEHIDDEKHADILAEKIDESMKKERQSKSFVHLSLILVILAMAGYLVLTF